MILYVLGIFLLLSIIVYLYILILEKKKKDEESSGEESGEGTKEENEKKYAKIWNNAHIYTYNRWTDLLETTIDPLTNRGKMTKPMCQKSEYKSKNGDRDISFLEWHDEVGKEGECINYSSMFLDACDSIADQYGQQKGYFKYVPPTFKCDSSGCNIDRYPTCDIPEQYCTQQIANYREVAPTCAGECYIDNDVETCGYLLGDVLCRMIGTQTGITIGTLLSSCNVGNNLCQPPKGIIIPDPLGRIININNTSNGYLRPKNLWDPKYANQLTINPKCQIFSDKQLQGMIKKQPWFLVSHDSDYKRPMAVFGHYYKNPGFNWYSYLDAIINYGINLGTSDTDLNIYTIDLVNFSDWATEMSTCNPLDTLIRMLKQMMVTNFSMRSFNTLAINGETWADKTKVFEIPFEFRKNPSSVPSKKPYRNYGVDINGNAPFEDYDRDRRWKSNLPLKPKYITDIVLMKWSSGFKIGDQELELILKTNLLLIEKKLFEVGEYISATKCPTDWSKYKRLNNDERNSSLGFLCYHTDYKLIGQGPNDFYPEVGTTISSTLVIENNSLICRLTIIANVIPQN